MDVPPPRPPATWRTWTGRPRRVAMGLGVWFVLAPMGVVAVREGWLIGNRCGGGNYMTAVVTLRTVGRAQAEVRTGCAIDSDGDGRGECGSFRELSGAVAVRGGESVLWPPVLSGVFRTLNADHTVSRSGYRFRLYLRRPDGLWGSADAPDAEIDPAAASEEFLCVAWPATYGMSGTHTLFADQTGAIVRTDNARYSGLNGPTPSAAPRTATGLTAGGGADGGAWTWVSTPAGR